MQASVPLLTLDGSHLPQGEAILHTTLMVACLTKQSFRIQNIRSHERKPGLNSEDLAIIRLLALSTHADLLENHIGSSELLFMPTQTPKALNHDLRIHEIIKGKGYGNITKILSIAIPILARTWEYSHLTVTAETHASSGFHYDFFEHLVLTIFQKQGIYTFPRLQSTNFNKKSMGEVAIEIEPSAFLPINWQQRGELKYIKIILGEHNMPVDTQKSIFAFMRKLLRSYEIEPITQVIPLDSKSPGFGLTLLAEFENGLGGFSMCQENISYTEDNLYPVYQQFKEWMDSQTTLSPNLLCYALIPMVFSKEYDENNPKTVLTTSQISSEVRAMIWVLKQIMPLKLTITETPDQNFQISFQFS